MESGVFRLISEHFTNNDVTSLAPAKEALGEGVSYGEIRLVHGYLQFIKEKESTL